ncbi:SEN54 [Candida margitis]|uniref:SEN54 n=1 Tax=Candida margitis TaxID=1775924 RepID=UPI002225F07F|nr:SEN54 [Candida margitis]KAI5969800.1 SEN54 [Candida margitis]
MSDIDDDEPPTATSHIQPNSHHDIEDEVQDWKLLGKFNHHITSTSSQSGTTTSSAIPKRGEKEFEPDGTTVQGHSLQESQQAMFDALSNIRGHHIKHKLVGVWVASINQCVILQIRGNFFRDMGTAAGSIMYLNPYEMVYLVERGSLIAYLSNNEFDSWLVKREHNKGSGGGDFDIESKLWALDLEYLYCLAMIDISQYQVYSYLKRLGYILQTPAATAPSVQYHNGKVHNPTLDVSFWLLPRQWGMLAYPTLHTSHFKTKTYFNYTNIYKAITLDLGKIVAPPPKDQLQITYNVWRPTPAFAKKSPPHPDFQLVVVDSSKSTAYLTLPQLQNLQSQLKIKPEGESSKKSAPKKQPRVESKRQLRAKQQAERQSKLDKSIQLRNEYWKRRDLGFKQGGNSIIVAIVNQGVINFINMSTGDFNCEFNKNTLDEIYPGKAHSIIYNE